jgi:isopentenyl-diphosphate Delta-isomerase
MAREEIVSNASEQLILVDDHDREIGFKGKADCHTGKGVLHRAFSIFVFNSDSELLLQQRSPTKMLWPGYWSNTCCSHPRRGEAMAAAVARRLEQELGFTCPLEYLYELCSVYFGRYDGGVDVNVNEIAAWRFVGVEALERELKVAPETFTPWFKMEWVHIKANYLDGMLASTGTDG